MTLWRKAAGALKDKNSILVANFSRRTTFRNTDLESAIIRATSHDECFVDKRNAQRVFAWIRASPISLRPFIHALSRRMEKTRSWVVAVKGLMLMHGVFCCKVPAVQKMGRLPFDFASFSDGHAKSTKTWGFNAFVRAYFAFLDQRAVISFDPDNKFPREDRPLMVQQLLRLQSWQSLLDLLLQIRPLADNMKVDLILEAMDCVIIEIFDIYSRICSEIARVLLKIHSSAGKHEAAMALKILQKATLQGEELSLYFEFCKDYGVLNANEFPTVTQIPDEDVQELQRIIDGRSGNISDGGNVKENNKMAIVLREGNNNAAIVEANPKGSKLQTIITDKWVIFDENLRVNSVKKTTPVAEGAAAVAATDLPLVPIGVPVYRYELPDLITF